MRCDGSGREEREGDFIVTRETCSTLSTMLGVRMHLCTVLRADVT